MTREDFISAVRGAVLAHDANRLEAAVGEIASFCYEDDQKRYFGAFDQGLFDFLVGTLRDPCFQTVPGAWRLLMLFEYDWGLLTDCQKQEIVEVLEEVYPTLREEMALFVTSELLGRFGCNRSSLSALSRLAIRLKNESSPGSELARALLPVGLNYIARDGADPSLRADALEQLRRLGQDESQAIRDEAREMLRWLISEKKIT